MRFLYETEMNPAIYRKKKKEKKEKKCTQRIGVNFIKLWGQW